jgi:hypothetical protein
MILPALHSKISDEVCIDETNTMSSDERWFNLFNIQLADLNRRADEAQEKLAKPKKYRLKSSHK